jgi:hypothetical protein
VYRKNVISEWPANKWRTLGAMRTRSLIRVLTSCGVLALFILAIISWIGNHDGHFEAMEQIQTPNRCFPQHEENSHPTLIMVPDVDKWEKTDIDGAVAILDPWLTREEVISMQKSNWEQPVKVISSCELDAVFSDKSITQEDPRLIEHLQRHVLFPPSQLQYNLSNPDVLDQSEFKSTRMFIWPLIEDLEV